MGYYLGDVIVGSSVDLQPGANQVGSDEVMLDGIARRCSARGDIQFAVDGA